MVKDSLRTWGEGGQIQIEVGGLKFKEKSGAGEGEGGGSNFRGDLPRPGIFLFVFNNIFYCTCPGIF